MKVLNLTINLLTLGVLVTGCLLLSPTGSDAQEYFDFESEAVDGVENGTFSSLSMTSTGGLTIDIFRDSGEGFDVLNVDALGLPNAYPSRWGSQALSPFANDLIDDWFVANFSIGVDGFYVEAGDFAGDEDMVMLEAYSGLNGSGALLDSTSFNWALGDMNVFGSGDAPAKLSVSGSEIMSVRFRGGAAGFENSMYFDNFRASVPEPTCLPILAGMMLAGCYRRKRMS